MDVLNNELWIKSEPAAQRNYVRAVVYWAFYVRLMSIGDDLGSGGIGQARR